MLRNKIFPSKSYKKFQHRSDEIFRIEALSDAVFAFSVSLLVAALEVPQTFHELQIITTGAIPYFLTVAMIFLFWYRQYLFFRRYGLNDFYIIMVNLFYLAVILFYVYPLKFLFSLLISAWSGINLFPKASEKGLQIVTIQEFPQLIMQFSIGYLLIWLLIYLMHRHALKLGEDLHLTPYEKLATQKEVRGALSNALIGLMAFSFALFHLPILSGFCYLLIPIALLGNQLIFKKALKKELKSAPH